MNEETNPVCIFATGLSFEPYGIDHLVDATGHHRLPLDPEFLRRRCILKWETTLTNR